MSSAYAHSHCAICGAAADGLHYGAISCRSCTAFFRRSVHDKPELQCTKDGHCTVTGEQRTKCMSCRFNRCLTAGMRREAVQPQRDKTGTQNRRNQKKSEPQEKANDGKEEKGIVGKLTVEPSVSKMIPYIIDQMDSNVNPQQQVKDYLDNMKPGSKESTRSWKDFDSQTLGMMMREEETRVFMDREHRNKELLKNKGNNERFEKLEAPHSMDKSIDEEMTSSDEKEGSSMEEMDSSIHKMFLKNEAPPPDPRPFSKLQESLKNPSRALLKRNELPILATKENRERSNAITCFDLLAPLTMNSALFPAETTQMMSQLQEYVEFVTLVMTYRDHQRHMQLRFATFQEFLDELNNVQSGLEVGHPLREMVPKDVDLLSSVELNGLLFWIEKLHPYPILPAQDKFNLLSRYSIRKLSLDHFYSASKHQDEYEKHNFVMNNYTFVPPNRTGFELPADDDKQRTAKFKTFEETFNRFWNNIITPFVQLRITDAEIVYLHHMLLWSRSSREHVTLHTCCEMEKRRDWAMARLMDWYQFHNTADAGVRFGQITCLLGELEVICELHAQDFQIAKLFEFIDMSQFWYEDLCYNSLNSGSFPYDQGLIESLRQFAIKNDLYGEKCKKPVWDSVTFAGIVVTLANFYEQCAEVTEDEHDFKKHTWNAILLRDDDKGQNSTKKELISESPDSIWDRKRIEAERRRDKDDYISEDLGDIVMEDLFDQIEGFEIRDLNQHWSRSARRNGHSIHSYLQNLSTSDVFNPLFDSSHPPPHY